MLVPWLTTSSLRKLPFENIPITKCLWLLVFIISTSQQWFYLMIENLFKTKQAMRVLYKWSYFKKNVVKRPQARSILSKDFSSSIIDVHPFILNQKVFYYCRMKQLPIYIKLDYLYIKCNVDDAARLLCCSELRTIITPFDYITDILFYLDKM